MANVTCVSIVAMINNLNNEIMNTAKNKLIDTIGRYNLSANNISKFKFSEKETDLFCRMMTEFAEEYHTEQLDLHGVSKWRFLATTRPNLENKNYTVLDKYGNIEENVLFGCSGFMGEPYSFFEGKKIASRDIIAFC